MLTVGVYSLFTFLSGLATSYEMLMVSASSRASASAASGPSARRWWRR
jgi:hypothetical protein